MICSSALFNKLGILDRLLTPAILVTMIVGVVIGEFVPTVQSAFDTVTFHGVSVRELHPHSSCSKTVVRRDINLPSLSLSLAIAIGLIIMVSQHIPHPS